MSGIMSAAEAREKSSQHLNDDLALIEFKINTEVEKGNNKCIINEELSDYVLGVLLQLGYFVEKESANKTTILW